MACRKTSVASIPLYYFCLSEDQYCDINIFMRNIKQDKEQSEITVVLGAICLHGWQGNNYCDICDESIYGKKLSEKKCYSTEYEKAFDTVRHVEMIKILGDLDIDRK